MQWKSNLCHSVPKAYFVPFSVLRTDELKSSLFPYVIEASAETVVYYLMKVTSHLDNYSVSKSLGPKAKYFIYSSVL